MLIDYCKYKERGEELKVLYYANAAAVRDGNLPYIIVTCLYSQHWQLFFCGCYLYITNAIKCNIIKHTSNTLLPVSTDLVSRD